MTSERWQRIEAAIAPGTRLGAYQVLAPLGRGGMGEVYRARDTKLQRDVALKVLPPSLALDEERLARFRREAQTLAALNHPNIAAIYGLEETDHGPALVLELVAGETLAERLARGPVPVSEALALAAQTAEALDAAHARGIVHRDLKPGNVMLRPDGTVKVLDFGLAKATMASHQEPDAPELETRTALTLAGRIQGTPPYMSPEQLRGREVDARTDLWAYGCLLFEVLVGTRAFPASGLTEAIAMILEREPDWQAWPAEAPEELTDLVRRCLVKPVEYRLQSAAEARTAVALASRPRVARRHDVPMPRSGLIGRTAELDGIEALFANPTARLVTLTGPGGSGKTRLAIEAARRCADRFQGGVRFVALAGVSAPEAVVTAIAQAFGIRLAAGVPALPLLCDELASLVRAPTLLVLDNFEHLLSASGALGELLDRCQPLRMLVTSRTVLRLYAEHEYPVLPLALPPADASLSIDDLAANPAVALFVERAAAAKPRFALTPENADDVREICARLDGLPLAIELAAARIRLFPPAVLRARLSKRLSILTGGPRDVPDRLQTLRRTIDWSHELLEPAEQRLFRRLAAFSGAFTLEAAEAVANAWQDLDGQILDGLMSLEEKSVVQYAEPMDGEPRFFLLETVREYALERLEAARELRTAFKAHAAYFLLRAEEVPPATSPFGFEQWLAGCDSDHDDLRAALDWLIANGQAEWAVRMGLALAWFWDARELFQEGNRYYAALVGVSEALGPTVARAQMLRHAAMNDKDGTSMRLEALEIYRALEDRKGEAGTLNDLGVSYQKTGDLVSSRRAQEQCVAICREYGEASYTAAALGNLASIVALTGELDRAEALATEALRMFEEVGDGRSVGWALSHLGDIARARGDLEHAGARYREAIKVFEATGEDRGVARTCIDLGHLALDRGDRSDAPRWFERALGILEPQGQRSGMVRLVDGVARLAGHTRRHDEAVTLSAAAASIRERTGWWAGNEPLMTIELVDNIDWASALDPAGEQVARARGSALTSSEVLDLARTVLR